MDVMGTIFNIIIAIIMKVLQFILTPIDWLISQSMPALGDGLAAVGSFISLMASGVGWAISAAGIPYAVVALIATYLIFKLTLPVQIWMIKLALKWYKALKL